MQRSVYIKGDYSGYGFTLQLPPYDSLKATLSKRFRDFVLWRLFNDTFKYVFTVFYIPYWHIAADRR